MLTVPDISEKLMRLDEITLLEILDISAEDLVNRFQDLIEERADQLSQELEGL